MFDQRTVAFVLVATLVGSAVGAGAVTLVQEPHAPTTNDVSEPPNQLLPPSDQLDTDNETAVSALASAAVEQFDSEAAFRRYVQRNRQGSTAAFLVEGGRTVTTATEGRDSASSGEDVGDGGANDRVSGTNVQERGIDEPDVLKTNGQVVFYAGGRSHDRRPAADTALVDISDAANPSMIGRVPVAGQLLLVDDVLVVWNDDAIYGFDVSTPEQPERLWRKQLNASVVTARLLDGRIYLVTSTGIDPSDPCPIAPFGRDGPTVDCTDVYHPTRPTNAEVTYTTSVIAPRAGDVTDSLSVVGAKHHRATYVSENAVYLTYTRRISEFTLQSTFLLTNQTDVLDDHVLERIRTLRTMNISHQAKVTELRVVLRRWYRGLSEDRRRAVRQSIQEDFRAYLNDHRRRLVRTGIVKIGVNGGLSVAATGEVPGVPLNQFSMDEHDDRLRIATTVGGTLGGRSSNDLYVLNESLGIIGAETGMADNQRIFSVRFVGNRAYLVTFRRVDPFHVVDLSDPADPTELGNVELPGFSRYLHPIGEDRVLGIGREEGHVKAVVFDVSDPSNPVVEDDLILDDRWSAIARTHHAFLHDERHGVFFLPGSRGGYVIDYTDGDLTVKKRVETVGRATRAMYHDDYLYVFDETGMVVVDETNWTTVDRTDFHGSPNEPDSHTDRVRPIEGL